MLVAAKTFMNGRSNEMRTLRAVKETFTWFCMKD